MCGSGGIVLKFLIRLLQVFKNGDFFIAFAIVSSLVPVVVCLVVGISDVINNKETVMVDDGLTTIEELVNALLKAKEDCRGRLLIEPPPTDDSGHFYTLYCHGEWDQLTCWPNSPPGTTVNVKCPEYVEDFDHKGTAQRVCGPDGNWSTVSNGTKIWSDYSGCNYQQEDEVVKLIQKGDPNTRSLILLYTVGYSFSLVALVFAMIILGYFKRLHCTRNFIHMHLFASFILRAVGIFVKDGVLYYGSGILDIKTKTGEDFSDSLKTQLEDGSSSVGCKIVITLFHYFVATNYYWILVEALYLHSLIFVAFFADKKYLWRFIATGWGVPILFVVPWAIVRATLVDYGCWDIAVTEFKWIYNGPIVVANVINFLLFLNIIRVLWSKMRGRGTVGRADNSRQYMKLAKSTLVLIPMFGVHAIVFIGMPDNVTSGIWWDIRMYFDLFFNSFQGFFVAIIYCFCNGEVQAEFRKAWKRFNLKVEVKKGRRDRNRSSMTMLTSFNSTTSHQGRMSIGGQSSRRGSRPNGGAPLLSNALSQPNEVRPHIVHASIENSSCPARDESSLIEKSSVARDEADNPLHAPRPPFIRAQSANIKLSSDVILPITEEAEPDLEAVLLGAVEERIACPAGSFNLAEQSRENSDFAFSNCVTSHVYLMEKADEFSDAMTSDETKRMQEKRKKRSRRAASEDSGISSTSTFYSVLRGRDRSASNSDYCADSEGDDVKARNLPAGYVTLARKNGSVDSEQDSFLQERRNTEDGFLRY